MPVQGILHEKSRFSSLPVVEEEADSTPPERRWRLLKE